MTFDVTIRDANGVECTKPVTLDVVNGCGGVASSLADLSWTLYQPLGSITQYSTTHIYFDWDPFHNWGVSIHAHCFICNPTGSDVHVNFHMDVVNPVGYGGGEVWYLPDTTVINDAVWVGLYPEAVLIGGVSATPGTSNSGDVDFTVAAETTCQMYIYIGNTGTVDVTLSLI